MTETQEILNVMSRYCRAVDDRQFGVLAELLAEDVRFEMGDVTESRAELLEYIQATCGPPDATSTPTRTSASTATPPTLTATGCGSTPTSCPLAPAGTPMICGASTGAGCSQCDESPSPSIASHPGSTDEPRWIHT